VIKVLLVDDSALMRKLLSQVFAAEGDFEVATARDGLDALAQAPIFAPDVITLDVTMPQMDGLQCLDRIMIERPCPVVMVSSLTAADADTTLDALRLGAVDFIAKPSGAVSLHIEEWAPELVRRVRTASTARLKSSLRLKERVRHRMGGAPAVRRAPQGPADKTPAIAPATGEGVVVIGTSTGGPPALEAVLTALPASFPWPILVAQHMPGSFTGALARRLDTLCAVSVQEVRQPVLLRPGHVYIGRGDADIIVSRRAGGLVAAAAPARDHPWHPSADRLVRSALDHLPASQIIGVLMTGMGNDGADAMAALHSAGGRTIAESEETAVVWGMPGELVKAKGADYVLPVHKISDRLNKLTP
jgi:two-component system chemotaxis response regulator CheB